MVFNLSCEHRETWTYHDISRDLQGYPLLDKQHQTHAYYPIDVH